MRKSVCNYSRRTQNDITRGDLKMTRKRFQKLFRSEMTKMMHGKPGAAACIKAAATSKPRREDGTFIPYGEFWTALRKVFIYGENIPPVK